MDSKTEIVKQEIIKFNERFKALSLTMKSWLEEESLLAKYQSQEIEND